MEQTEQLGGHPKCWKGGGWKLIQVILCCMSALFMQNIDFIYNMGFPCGSAGKKSACNVGDLGSIPGFGRSPREGKGYPLQYSGLQNSMNCIVHGVTKSQTQLSDFHFTVIWTSLVAQTVKRLPTMRETWVQFLGQEDLLEKEMATHSSTLAWKTPWTEKPGRLQSMGSQRVRHDWATLL